MRFVVAVFDADGRPHCERVFSTHQGVAEFLEAQIDLLVDDGACTVMVRDEETDHDTAYRADMIADSIFAGVDWRERARAA